MPKETRAQRTFREQREAEELQFAREVFLKTLPERLAKVNARYRELGIYPEITLTPNGPAIHFNHDVDFYIDSTLTYSSEEWEVESVEKVVEGEYAKRFAAKLRYEKALDIWQNLEKTDRDALREFIGRLP